MNAEPTTGLKDQIERFLLERGGWVPGSVICAAFELRSDRILRGVGSKPGLCSDFAISSDKGFKHIRCASSREYIAFKHRMRRHAVAELSRSRLLDQRRNNLLKHVRSVPFDFQPDTGQGVFF